MGGGKQTLRPMILSPTPLALGGAAFPGAGGLRGTHPGLPQGRGNQPPKGPPKGIERRGVPLCAGGLAGGGRWGGVRRGGEDNAGALRTGLDASGRRAGLPGRGRQSNWFHHGRN